MSDFIQRYRVVMCLVQAKLLWFGVWEEMGWLKTHSLATRFAYPLCYISYLIPILHFYNSFSALHKVHLSEILVCRGHRRNTDVVWRDAFWMWMRWHVITWYFTRTSEIERNELFHFDYWWLKWKVLVLTKTWMTKRKRMHSKCRLVCEYTLFILLLLLFK